MPPKGRVRWLSPAEQAAKDAANQQSINQSLNQLLQIFHGQIDDNVIQLVFQSNNQSFDQSMEALSQMVEDTPQEVRKSINQPVNRSSNQSAKQPINTSSQWAGGSINQPKKPVNPSIDSPSLWPSLSGESNQSTIQSLNKPVNQPSASQSLNNRIQKSTKPSTNQSFNQSISCVDDYEAVESIWDPPTTNRSISQSSTQSPSQSSNHSNAKSNTRSARQTPTPSTDRLNSPSHNQSGKPSVDEPVHTIHVLNEDSDFSESELTSQLVDSRSKNLSIDQPANQLTTRSTTVPTYQTITNGELDPMHYLVFVNQSIDRMRDVSDHLLARQLQQKLSMEPIEQSADQSANQSINQSITTFPELSHEQVKQSKSTTQSINSSQSSNPSVNQSTSLDREGLLELLCLMFDSIDRSLIESLIDSIEESTVESINSVVETLTSITAEEQLRDDDSDDPSEYPSINQSSTQSTGQSAKLGTGDQKLELTDLEIAQRMASDPKWSPPRASRSLTQSTSQSLNQSFSASNKRFSKSKSVKLDLSKPVFAWPTNQPLTDQWKMKSIKQCFPTVEQDLIDEIFAVNQSNYQSSINHLRELFPDECKLSPNELPPILDQSTDQSMDAPVRPKRYSAASIASRVNRPSAAQSTNQSAAQPVDDTDYEGESLIPDSVLEYELGPTLDNRAHHSTGDTFTRSDAAAHSNRRALFFRAATACFHANKGAEARRFAKLGHDEGAMIMETSVASAAQLFRSNNKDLDCSRKIDLHGLHVKEAICFLDFAIRRMRRRGGGDALIAVTGRGMHSAGGKSKLKPAVQRYCDRHRYRSAQIKNAEVRITFG